MSGRGLSWPVALVIVAAIAGVVALSAVSEDGAREQLPLLIAFIAPTITSLIAASKSDANGQGIAKIEKAVNGDLEPRVRAWVRDEVTQALRSYHAATAEDCAGPECR